MGGFGLKMLFRNPTDSTFQLVTTRSEGPLEDAMALVTPLLLAAKANPRRDSILRPLLEMLEKQLLQSITEIWNEPENTPTPENVLNRKPRPPRETRTRCSPGQHCRWDPKFCLAHIDGTQGWF